MRHSESIAGQIGYDRIVNDAPDSDEDFPPPWDADDPRRQKDQFAPPMVPCECYCLHCQRFFMSDLMWFQRVKNSKDESEGFWMCPTPNCDGAGFTFDIFPADPDHPANAGWTWTDEEDDIEFDDEGNPVPESDRQWNSDESQFADDDDIEGEEWKFGLQPGERPEHPMPKFSSDEARRAWEADQKKYEGPDLRPREIELPERGPGEQRKDDDLPF